MNVAGRPADIPPTEHFQCCTCGGTGLDSYGETCEHCEGLGFC
ncbi:hypothetical protein [Actinoallomurus iriomotensis]|nr:hypothetical protein [Actinoallomurus iriomotensis]